MRLIVSIAMIVLGVFSFIVNFKKYREIKSSSLVLKAKKALYDGGDSQTKIKTEFNLISLREKLSSIKGEILLSILIIIGGVIGILFLK